MTFGSLRSQASELSQKKESIRAHGLQQPPKSPVMGHFLAGRPGRGGSLAVNYLVNTFS